MPLLLEQGVYFWCKMFFMLDQTYNFGEDIDIWKNFYKNKVLQKTFSTGFLLSPWITYQNYNLWQ